MTDLVIGYAIGILILAWSNKVYFDIHHTLSVIVTSGNYLY
jgi:hypothetical protein